MKKAFIAFGILSFVPSVFADIAEKDIYQCEFFLKSPGATSRSKFIFDGTPYGMSFNYIQTYSISVYKYFDANSQIEWIHLGITGNSTGPGFVEYPAGIPFLSFSYKMAEILGTVQISCEKKNN